MYFRLNDISECICNCWIVACVQLVKPNSVWYALRRIYVHQWCKPQVISTCYTQQLMWSVFIRYVGETCVVRGCTQFYNGATTLKSLSLLFAFFSWWFLAFCGLAVFAGASNQFYRVPLEIEMCDKNGKNSVMSVHQSLQTQWEEISNS